MKSLMLTAFGLMCSATSSAFEVDGINYNILNYEYRMVEVISSNNKYCGDITIPKKVQCDGNTYNVISIGDKAFQYCNELTSISMPESIVTIGEMAFYSCDNLTSVVIPEGVETIKQSAFLQCKNLSYIKLPQSLTVIYSYAFDRCDIKTVVAINHEPAGSYLGNPPFSKYTLNHATLFIPEGTYWDYVYTGNGGWGEFIHIKEMAMTEGALLSNKAYLIADSKGTNFKVYDAERDALKNVEYTHALDEESEDCCWTVMKENGKTYLYNLGANKFGVVGDNGAITLSETPVHVAISETEGGLSINGNNCMFVLNKHVEVDATGISDVLLNGQDAKNAQIHSLDGRRQQTLRRGVNIVNGKKVLVK